MKFVELTVHTTSEGSELIADVMWRYTSYGVAISDVKDVIALQRDKSAYWDYMDEDLVANSSGDVLVKAFIAVADADKVIPEIRRDIEDIVLNCAGALPLGTLETARREIEGDDWIEIWRTHFRPIHLGSVVVVPEWIEYEAADGEKTVKLDNNMAFGTGEHETTSMCVELLQKYITPDSVCIDVGCGSGILGISAVKLGAKFAYLTDIDIVAVESATHNAELNGVLDRVTVARSNLLDDSSLKGDIMLANITADILENLAPSIPKNLKAGGTLILSGIIDCKKERVVEVYSAQGLKLCEQVKKGEWNALAFKG
ncbi:MAG: 50S ribosomal protein L11 methyltransferase [Clostridiales bacterium]|nr:50S ribosomal protein L11 methyltransferase [Clostridiales bacterium]